MAVLQITHPDTKLLQVAVRAFIDAYVAGFSEDSTNIFDCLPAQEVFFDLEISEKMLHPDGSLDIVGFKTLIDVLMVAEDGHYVEYDRKEMQIMALNACRQLLGYKGPNVPRGKSSRVIVKRMRGAWFTSEAKLVETSAFGTVKRIISDNKQEHCIRFI